MSTFQAGTQHGDFKGGASFDELVDGASLTDLLRSKGLAENDEILVGFRMAFVESQHEPVDLMRMMAYLHKGSVDDITTVRAVETEMSFVELSKFFKDFDMVVTRRAADLSKAELTGAKE